MTQPMKSTENSPAGAEVGIRLRPCADNASYTLTDDADGRFAISNNGFVTVADRRQAEL